jgi:fructose-1,6-bisphosphatase I
MQEIFEKIEEIALEIDHLIKTAECGYSESCNSTGDVQLKLDILSDEIIEKRLGEVASINSLISEEKEDILEVSSSGKYTVCNTCLM